MFLRKALFCSAASLASSVVADIPLYEGLKRPELEKLEYDRPDDPILKQELARIYWCEGEKGLAVEHWRWLSSASIFRDSSETELLLKKSSENPKILTNSLCQHYPQKSL